MSKQLGILLLALASLGAMVGAKLQHDQQPHRYIIYKGFDKLDQRILKHHGEQFHWEGSNLILESDDPQHLLSTLSLMADAQEHRLDCFYVNLGNRQTTHTSDGQPFQRQVARFNDNGQFVEVETEPTSTIWVEDTNHPDALKNGPHKGFVPYPDVCLWRETNCVNQAQEELNTIANLMLSVDEHIILPKSQGFLSSSAFNFGHDPYPGMNLTIQDQFSKGHQCDANCVKPYPEDRFAP